MDRFRNINYPYANQDDTFTARGFQLNMIVDEINALSIGTPVIVEKLGTTDVVIGLTDKVKAAFIDYWTDTADTFITNYAQTGTIEIRNGLEHPNVPTLDMIRHSSGNQPQQPTIVVIQDAGNIVLRITNTTALDMEFLMSTKIISYE
jgi:hypothetical protein